MSAPLLCYCEYNLVISGSYCTVKAKLVFNSEKAYLIFKVQRLTVFNVQCLTVCKVQHFTVFKVQHFTVFKVLRLPAA